MMLFVAHPPPRLRASYEHDVNLALVRSIPPTLVTKADLMYLPPPVQRYLRLADVVGRPRVHNFRVRMHGRFRIGPKASWMPVKGEQHNFIDEPARFFFLHGSMFGIPIQGYHRYVGSTATMDVRAMGLIQVARASGPEMDVGETVTMFNDMCVMAPATLIDPSIEWTGVDDRHARAQFTNAGHTITAELEFNDAAELINFWSDDRYQLSDDGRTAKRVRWSTPMREYTTFGLVRLASAGAAWWHEPGHEYPYIELTFDDVRYNVGRSGWAV
jgi:hypothetical protein